MESYRPCRPEPGSERVGTWGHAVLAPMVFVGPLLGLTMLWFLGKPAFAQPVRCGDLRLSSYTRPAQPVEGSLQIVSSVATAALATQWTVALQDQLPELDIQTWSVETAMMSPWWTVGGPHTVAVLGQPMAEQEMAAFEQQFGYQPIRLRVVQDAVAVLVHRSNPVVQCGLTLPELDAIFSTTRVRGHAEIQGWGDLGINARLAERPMALYGQDAAAHLYVYFRRRVLRDGDFKATVARLPSSADVVAAVSSDINAIGYASTNVVTASVAVVPLVDTPGQSAIAPIRATIQQQRYPLTYFVALYLTQHPDTALPPPTARAGTFRL